MRYVFGPVPSRRLGRSLGVDLVPFKTCSYDCIYCQLGVTTNKTVERREWVPLEEVVAELRDKLDSRPDYITLAGSGEPTLYSRLGELIDRIREMSDTPVAVLTNGSLLWREDVRRDLLHASLVVPSLDAGTESSWETVNRPHAGVSFEKMVEGLIAFSKEYKGDYHLEVFLTEGFTANEDEVRAIAEIIARIQPDRVQVNTVTRPPAEGYAGRVERARLEELAAMLRPDAEVIADYRGVHKEPEFSASREAVLQMLERRPCSVDDIAGGLGIHRNEAIKYVEELLGNEAVEPVDVGGKVFYRVRKG